MRIFYVTEPLDVAIAYDRHRKRFRVDLDAPAPAAPAAPGAVRTHRIRLESAGDGRAAQDALYFATSFEWAPLTFSMLDAQKGDALKLLSIKSSEKLLATPPVPRRLGCIARIGESFVPLDEQIDALGLGSGVETLRIGIINMLHPAFGDTILFTTLIRELRRHLRGRFRDVEIDLFQSSYNAEADLLYHRCEAVHAVHPVPAPLGQLMRYHAYFDFSVAEWRSDLPWIDALLEAVGIDPATVPAERKRNRLKIEPAVARELALPVAAVRTGGRKVLLFHPKASTEIRSLPPERAVALVHQILEATDYTVASAVPLAVDHPRFVDWSPLSRTFDHLTYLVSQADAYVSVDTSLYHVADAFDVPGVVLFTSIRPEHRVAYYPFARGLLMRDGNRLLGMHKSEKEDDIAYSRELWDALDTGGVLEALEDAVRARRAAP